MSLITRRILGAMMKDRKLERIDILILLYLLALPFTRGTPVPTVPVRIAYADICYLMVMTAGLWVWFRYRWHGPTLLL